MSTPINNDDDARRSLDREADLVDRFAQMYRSHLSHLVQTLNASVTGPQPMAPDPIRHCVEAVDMVLASHAQFAKSLKKLASTMESPPVRRAA
jgi:hypothetical protein